MILIGPVLSHNFLFAESNKLYFSGKSIFTLNERYGNKLCYLGKDEYVARQPFEIEDFEAYCTDVEGNRDEFVDIAAGGTHFVVLTSTILSFFINKQKQENIFSNVLPISMCPPSLA